MPERIRLSKRAKPVRMTAPMAKGEALPSLTKTKGMYALLMLAEGRGSPKPGEIYEIPVEVIRELLRCRDDEHLKSELEGLRDLKLNWAKFDPKARGYSVPVSSCIWNEGYVTFAFDPQFIEAWLDNATGFRRISWEVLSEMRSKHAAKLYQLAAYMHEAKEVRKTRAMSILELRELFGVRADQYPDGTFYQQVITPSVKAVNQAKLGFIVRYERSGRGKTAEHWFVITPGPKQERMPLAPVRVVHHTVAPAPEILFDRVMMTLEAQPEERRAELLRLLQERGTPLPSRENPAGIESVSAALEEAGVDIVPASHFFTQAMSKLA